MAAPDPQVVSKYLACTQIDTSTGECVASVWVDPPAILPELPLGFTLAMCTVIGLGWIAIAGNHVVQDAVRDN